jgi:hypothetical protein
MWFWYITISLFGFYILWCSCNCCKRNVSNIMSHVSDFIRPIRLHILLGDLAGATVRVSGWGKTSDSKYKFLIILYFKLKNLTLQNGCFKAKKFIAFRIFCGHCEYFLFILWYAECKDCPRLYGSVIWTRQLVLYIH